MAAPGDAGADSDGDSGCVSPGEEGGEDSVSRAPCPAPAGAAESGLLRFSPHAEPSRAMASTPAVKTPLRIVRSFRTVTWEGVYGRAPWFASCPAFAVCPPYAGN